MGTVTTVPDVSWRHTTFCLTLVNTHYCVYWTYYDVGRGHCPPLEYPKTWICSFLHLYDDH